MRSGNWNSAYKGLQSRLTMGLFRLLYIAGSQRPVKIDELRHATTIWTPGDLPHRHWPSYRTKTICFVLVRTPYVYLFNLCWTGFTSPQPIVGRVYPSTLAFYPSKGRVDGSLDEAVCGTGYPYHRIVAYSGMRLDIWEQTWHFSTLRKSAGKAWRIYSRLGAFLSNWTLTNESIRDRLSLIYYHNATQTKWRRSVNNTLRLFCFSSTLQFLSAASSVSPVHLHVPAVKSSTCADKPLR